MFGISVTQGVYYYWYELIKAIFEADIPAGPSGNVKRRAMTTLESMGAGAVAGIATSVITNPIWVVNVTERGGRRVACGTWRESGRDRVKQSIFIFSVWPRSKLWYEFYFNTLCARLKELKRKILWLYSFPLSAIFTTLLLSLTLSHNTQLSLDPAHGQGRNICHLHSTSYQTHFFTSDFQNLQVRGIGWLLQGSYPCPFPRLESHYPVHSV